MAEEKKDPMNTMEEEITEAKKQAAEEKEDTISTFKLRLKKPFSWEGNEYTELDFDWSELTGEEFLNIESEVNAEGYAVITPEFSTIFLVYMAVRGCKQPIGTDAIRKLPIGAFNKVRSRARSFLLNSEI